ncbi:hypothetical protein [Elizabethkingia sp. YR214]|nr:hypothetical protein [Elizabethkingia sp. YR214]
MKKIISRILNGCAILFAVNSCRENSIAIENFIPSGNGRLII